MDIIPVFTFIIVFWVSLSFQTLILLCYPHHLGVDTPSPSPVSPAIPLPLPPPQKKAEDRRGKDVEVKAETGHSTNV